MNHTKGQFYAIWIIFGYAVFYSLFQTISLIKELTIIVGVYFDLKPVFIKNSNFIIYIPIWISLVTLLVVIIKQKQPLFTAISGKSMRLAFIFCMTLGLTSQILTKVLRDNRIDLLNKYLENRKLSYLSLYPDYLVSTAIPNIMIFITLIVGYTILTRKKL